MDYIYTGFYNVDTFNFKMPNNDDIKNIYYKEQAVKCLGGMIK